MINCQPMKPYHSINCRTLLWCAGLAGLLGVAPGVFGAPPKTPATAVQTNAPRDDEVVFPKSEFEERGGKDPFFPNRVITPITITVAPIASEASRFLVLNGILGTTSKPLVTINGRPFEAGEEGEVITPAGKLKIRCIEIRKDSVMVEIITSGERKELRLRGGP